DGRKQDFDLSKIVQAIFQAAQQLNEKYSLEEARKIAMEVGSRVDHLTEDKINRLTTTDIDELVLEVLEQKEYPLLKKAYINRREEKAKGRKDRRDVNVMIQQLLQQDKTIVNENANKDSKVFNTQRDLTAGIVGKAIGLKLYPLMLQTLMKREKFIIMIWITPLIHQ